MDPSPTSGPNTVGGTPATESPGSTPPTWSSSEVSNPSTTGLGGIAAPRPHPVKESESPVSPLSPAGEHEQGHQCNVAAPGQDGPTYYDIFGPTPGSANSPGIVRPTCEACWRSRQSCDHCRCHATPRRTGHHIWQESTPTPGKICQLCARAFPTDVPISISFRMNEPFRVQPTSRNDVMNRGIRPPGTPPSEGDCAPPNQANETLSPADYHTATASDGSMSQRPVPGSPSDFGFVRTASGGHVVENSPVLPGTPMSAPSQPSGSSPTLLSDWRLAQNARRQSCEQEHGESIRATFDTAPDRLIRMIYTRMRNTPPGEYLPAIQITTFLDDLLITTDQGTWIKPWGEVLRLWVGECTGVPYEQQWRRNVTSDPGYVPLMNSGRSHAGYVPLCRPMPPVDPFAPALFPHPSSPRLGVWTPRFRRNIRRSVSSAASLVTTLGHSSNYSDRGVPTDSSSDWSPFVARTIGFDKKPELSNAGVNIVLVHVASRQDFMGVMVSLPESLQGSQTVDFRHSFRGVTIINLGRGRAAIGNRVGVRSPARLLGPRPRMLRLRGPRWPRPRRPRRQCMGNHQKRYNS